MYGSWMWFDLQSQGNKRSVGHFCPLGGGGGAYSRGDQPELAILSILLCLTPDDFTRQQVNALFVSKRFNNC